MRLDAPPATCVLPTVQIRDVARFRLQPLAMPSVSAYARTAGAADGARRTWAKSQRQGLSGRVSAALVQPDLRGALALALPEGADQSVGGELVGDPLRRRAPGRRDVGRVAADEHVVDQPSAVRARERRDTGRCPVEAASALVDPARQVVLAAEPGGEVAELGLVVPGIDAVPQDGDEARAVQRRVGEAPHL